MAEPTLSLSLDDFRIAIGHYMGYGTTYSSMAAGDVTVLDACVKEGYLNFLNPARLGTQFNHEWSFMSPTATLTTSAPYSTGTLTIASGVVTGSGTTFPSWAADGQVVVSGNSYSVSTRNSDTGLTLDDTSVTVAAGTSYTLTRPNMDLPDNFGGLDDEFSYQPMTGKAPLTVTSEYEIKRYRASMSWTGSHPRECAIRPLPRTTEAIGQRFEVLFWPDPDAAYRLEYRYKVIQNTLDASNKYPLGGGLHSETIQAAMLASAERWLDPAPAVFAKREHFMEALASSVAMDAQANAADNLGYNEDKNWQRRYRISSTNRHRDGGSWTVSYP